MQTVKGTCGECWEDVFLTPEGITVHSNHMNRDLSTYTFTCPKCGQTSTKPAGENVRASLAMARGVKWVILERPAEMDEAHVGPPLTESDVADFAIDLGLAPDHLISILAGGGK